jgi:multisubunit Na+/H+ antiporter MnhE subunit
MRRLALILLGALIGGAFYLVLIDTTSLPELYVLAGAALIAGLAFAVSREEGLVEATITPGLLVRSWRAIASIPLQSAIVSWEALAQLAARDPSRGGFRAVPFRAGTSASRDVGRRALAQAFGSLAPNTIVIGVDDERDLLLVHQLRPRGSRDELDVLGIG